MEPTTGSIIFLGLIVIAAAVFVIKLVSGYGADPVDERRGGWNEVYTGERDRFGASVYQHRKAWKL